SSSSADRVSRISRQFRDRASVSSYFSASLSNQANRLSLSGCKQAKFGLSISSLSVERENDSPSPFNRNFQRTLSCESTSAPPAPSSNRRRMAVKSFERSNR